MKTTLALFTILLAILIFPGFTFNSGYNDLKGNGHVTRQERQAGPYTSISVNSGIDVYLIQGSEEKVEVEADENLQSTVKTEVENGELRIYSDKSIRHATKRMVYVTFKQLTGIQANGGSDVFTQQPVQIPELSVHLNGGSDLHMEGTFNTISLALNGGSDAMLKGSATSAIFDANGGSDLKAGDFLVKDCKVSAVGGSDSWVNVKENITIRAIGGSDVYFTGDPKIIDSEVSGGSDLKKKPSL